MNWSDFHDTSLKEIRLSWKKGTIDIGVTYFEAGSLCEGTIHGEGVFHLSCPRELPWGMSESINSVSQDHDQHKSTLTIEMQSGDEISIQARSFEWIE